MRTSGANKYPSVLVIDDEETMRDLTRRSLEAHGFRCEVAADGVAGENLLRRTRFDAIVVDLRMPRKHGHQLITEVLQQPTHPVVVVLTGILEPKIVQDLLVRGVADVMLKPCNYDLLSAKLTTYLLHRETAGGTQPRAVSAQIDTTTQSLKAQLEEVSRSFQDTIEQLTHQKDALEEDLVRSVGVLESLMSLGEHKGESHACRVEQLARAVGEAAGLTRIELKFVRVAALLHEIGQFGMPDPIRNSPPDQLAPSMLEVYQRYPEIGAALISEIPGLHDVVTLIESHTENYDGTGFPKRRRGKDILLGARVLRIADGVDCVLQSANGDDRVIREHLMDQRGRAYDPDLVPHALAYANGLQRSSDAKIEAVAVDALEPGMALAEALYDERGQFLARSGATITPPMLELLTRLVPGRTIRVRRPATVSGRN